MINDERQLFEKIRGNEMEADNQQHYELKDFLNVEMEIILKHIDEHKWCNHIVDKNEAIADFISKYAWIIRETFGAAYNLAVRCQEESKNEEKTRDI
jgi:hypothetical protein